LSGLRAAAVSGCNRRARAGARQCLAFSRPAKPWEALPLFPEQIAGLDAAEVGQQLADEADALDVRLGHPARDGDDAAVLQPVAADVVDHAAPVEGDGDDLALHLLGLTRADMLEPALDVEPADVVQQALRRGAADLLGHALAGVHADLDLRQLGLV